MSYSEDGQHFWGCRDCGAIWAVDQRESFLCGEAIGDAEATIAGSRGVVPRNGEESAN
jgi:hypothetical protein